MMHAVLDALRVRPMWVLVLLAACTVGDGSENASSFGTASMTAASTTMSSSSATSSATTEDDDTESSDPMTSDADSTTEAPEASGTATSSGSGEATSADTATEQPPDGMYSACEQVTDCVGLTNCQSGFCTRACVDPTMDCDPAPGGTATPACVMFETQTLCALPCDGGETCPTPMACTAVTGGSVCA